MRRYLLKSRIQPQAWKRVLDEYDNLADLGKELIETLGGKSLSQYVGATDAVTFSIIQFPKSPARLLYQLMDMGIYAEVELTELLSENDFQKVVDNLI